MFCYNKYSTAKKEASTAKRKVPVHVTFFYLFAEKKRFQMLKKKFQLLKKVSANLGFFYSFLLQKCFNPLKKRLQHLKKSPTAQKKFQQL